MKAGRWCWALLALAIVLQWALPASLAWRSEQILRSGTRYYLRTAPVDPLDAFRGRYVALRFTDATVRLPAGADWPAGSRLYVPLLVGADRYAHFGTPLRAAPAHGDYLEARLRRREADGTVQLALPFDRYYVEERLAPAAEQAYRAAAASAPAAAYVSIRVRGGEAVLEELFIDNVPLRQRLREAQRD